MKSQARLFARHLHDLPPGRLTWIGLRPAHKAAMVETDRVNALKDSGLEGDHRTQKTPGSGRQVTVISLEFINQITHFTGHKAIHPALLRRNLVVRNINLNALRHQQFIIGEAVFEATALCHPCSRMEKALGKGAVAAMLGHGGLCLKVIKGGEIKIGDHVQLITPEQKELL